MCIKTDLDCFLIRARYCVSFMQFKCHRAVSEQLCWLSPTDWRRQGVTLPEIPAAYWAGLSPTEPCPCLSLGTPRNRNLCRGALSTQLRGSERMAFEFESCSCNCSNNCMSNGYDSSHFIWGGPISDTFQLCLFFGSRIVLNIVKHGNILCWICQYKQLKRICLGHSCLVCR